MRLHWFTRAGDGAPGTLNLAYELLDYPVALGRAEAAVRFDSGSELSLAEILDRSARAAGVLRLTGLGPGARIAVGDLDPAPAALISLAVLRIGGILVCGHASDAPSSTADSPWRSVAGQDRAAGDREAATTAEALVRRSAEPPPQISRMPGAGTVTRAVPSHLDGIELLHAGETLPLGALVKDARLQHSAALGAPADQRPFAGRSPLAGLDLQSLAAAEQAPPGAPGWLGAVLRSGRR